MDTFYDEEFENKADVDYLFLLINEGTKSEDLKVREIYQNIINIKKIEPRFQLFLSVKTGFSYMHQFKALNVIKVLFGNEWYNAMEETIEKIYNSLNDEMNLKK